MKCLQSILYREHLKRLDTISKAFKITRSDSQIVKKMSQPNNPLHGVKLEQIITELQAHYGWEYMGYQIKIRCFTDDPSVKSSLKFLRRTPWARTKVEDLYLEMLRKKR